MDRPSSQPTEKIRHYLRERCRGGIARLVRFIEDGGIDPTDIGAMRPEHTMRSSRVVVNSHEGPRFSRDFVNTISPEQYAADLDALFGDD